ncbi:MAG: polysaccharide lyase family 8 super-sandwich domain-containing protein [Cyclobacteriaceae bacterium]|nr:polysaccharide lyase family 8 super-sandwich domain-containing protein [Cyclobacteriaceae bacterium]
MDWVFHDSIGYIFPEPSSINLKNSLATGSWWTINKQSDSPKDEVKLDVFKLWLDHGNRPSDASYAYIVSPATSIDALVEEKSKGI